MRGLPLFLVVSLGAHVAAAASLLVVRSASVPDPSPVLAGETFELPAPETDGVTLANASPSPEQVAPEAPPAEGVGPAHPSPPPQGRAASRASHVARPSGGRASSTAPEGTPGETGTTALYGAVGERSASDLPTAFTRGFPQAASADPLWRSAPLGPMGAVDVVLTLDANGHLENSEVLGAPSPALASAIRRTIALIRARPFVAKAKTTRLHLTTTITADTVHDGLHGEVFAVGGSFAGGEGSAFFALAIGRRIDLRVRAK